MQQKQHLTVTYVDEAGIEVRIDIDVSAFTLDNSAGGGSIKWRNQGAAVQPSGGSVGGGFLGKLVSDGLAAAARPSPRDRPRRYRPAVTAADAPEQGGPAEVEDSSADPAVPN